METSIITIIIIRIKYKSLMAITQFNFSANSGRKPIRWKKKTIEKKAFVTKTGQ